MPKVNPLPDMTEEEARAFRWALDQDFPSVSARSAKSIAGYIERHRADLTLSPSAPRGVEQRYSTKALIENLQNALDSGYDYLGETDIGDLLQTIKDDERENMPPADSKDWK